MNVMKLSDLYEKPLKEILEGMELSDTKVHADDTGEIKCIELKYKAKKTEGSKAGEGKATVRCGF